MDSERDYRKEALKDLGFGLFTNIAPGTLNAQQALNQALEFFFKSVPTTEAMYLRVLGRDFPIRRSWKGSVCAFGFSELFETPSSTAEYLAVAEAFDCIVIDQLKPFSASAESSCRRFTNALDVWYDQKKRIICLSSSPVEQLFSALEKSTGTSAADPRFSMKVTNEGGSTSSQTTFIQDPLRKDPMEWSATGRKEASLAALFKSKHDEALLLRRAVSRLKEIERRGDFLIVKT
jgi:predicted ATPase